LASQVGKKLYYDAPKHFSKIIWKLVSKTAEFDAELESVEKVVKKFIEKSY
jgi:hypothetical protein